MNTEEEVKQALQGKWRGLWNGAFVTYEFNGSSASIAFGLAEPVTATVELDVSADPLRMLIRPADDPVPELCVFEVSSDELRIASNAFGDPEEWPSKLEGGQVVTLQPWDGTVPAPEPEYADLAVEERRGNFVQEAFTLLEMMAQSDRAAELQAMPDAQEEHLRYSMEMQGNIQRLQYKWGVDDETAIRFHKSAMDPLPEEEEAEAYGDALDEEGGMYPDDGVTAGSAWSASPTTSASVVPTAVPTGTLHLDATAALVGTGGKGKGEADADADDEEAQLLDTSKRASCPNLPPMASMADEWPRNMNWSYKEKDKVTIRFLVPEERGRRSLNVDVTDTSISLLWEGSEKPFFSGEFEAEVDASEPNDCWTVAPDMRATIVLQKRVPAVWSYIWSRDYCERNYDVDPYCAMHLATLCATAEAERKAAGGATSTSTDVATTSATDDVDPARKVELYRHAADGGINEAAVNVWAESDDLEESIKYMCMATKVTPFSAPGVLALGTVAAWLFNGDHVDIIRKYEQRSAYTLWATQYEVCKLLGSSIQDVVNSVEGMLRVSIATGNLDGVRSNHTTMFQMMPGRYRARPLCKVAYDMLLQSAKAQGLSEEAAHLDVAVRMSGPRGMTVERAREVVAQESIPCLVAGVPLRRQGEALEQRQREAAAKRTQHASSVARGSGDPRALGLASGAVQALGLGETGDGSSAAAAATTTTTTSSARGSGDARATAAGASMRRSDAFTAAPSMKPTLSIHDNGSDNDGDDSDDEGEAIDLTTLGKGRRGAAGSRNKKGALAPQPSHWLKLYASVISVVAAASLWVHRR